MTQPIELFVCSGQTFKTIDEANDYSDKRKSLTGKYHFVTRYDLDKYANCFEVKNGEWKFIGFPE